MTYLRTPAKVVTAAYTITRSDSAILADATGQQPPTAVTARPVATGGTFAARTNPQGYYWAVTAVGPLGESVALVGGAQGIAANGSAVLNWVAAPGATSYKIYRGQFQTNVYPPLIAGTQGLVASGVVGTTYTDTGTATTAGTPPATNFGSAFTLTLPDATLARGILNIRAIGNTAAVVTVASVSGQQIGSLGTSVLLGQTAAAYALGIQLISDGTNWLIVSHTPAPLWQRSGVGLNAGTITPAQGLVPVAILSVPRFGFGHRASVRSSCQLLPAAGATIVYPEIYWCTAAGAYQGFNSGLAGTMNGSQIAFWYDQAFSPGEYSVFSGNWDYDPRPGDYNVEGGGWGGYDANLGLFVQTVGGNCTVVSSSIDMTAGAVASQYFGAF